VPIFFKIFLFFLTIAALAAAPSIASDSLVVKPAKPTASDSLSLSILARDWNCCTRFIYDSTAVTLVDDSTITLRFAYVAGLCPCPSNPVASVLTYKRGPLPIGNYSVYEVESQSCTTGQVCTNLVVQALIGKFTVSKPTAALFQQKSVPLEDIGKMPRNAHVYDIRGAIISSNSIGASKRNSGVYFFKSADRAPVKMKIWY
jgi:hypothetical protein